MPMPLLVYKLYIIIYVQFVIDVLAIITIIIIR